MLNVLAPTSTKRLCIACDVASPVHSLGQPVDHLSKGITVLGVVIKGYVVRSEWSHFMTLSYLTEKPRDHIVKKIHHYGLYV